MALNNVYVAVSVEGGFEVQHRKEGRSETPMSASRRRRRSARVCLEPQRKWSETGMLRASLGFTSTSTSAVTLDSEPGTTRTITADEEEYTR